MRRIYSKCGMEVAGAFRETNEILFARYSNLATNVAKFMQPCVKRILFPVYCLMQFQIGL